MANLVITAEGAGYKVTSNDVDTGWDDYLLLPGDIVEVHINGSVIVVLDDGKQWELTLIGTDGEWKVDTVLGETPGTISALSTMIFALRLSANKLVSVGLDANSASATNELDLGDAKYIGMYVIADTGTHATHVITLQVSPDDTNWYNTTHTVTGVGFTHEDMCIGHSVRAKVTTLEGAPSTVDVMIFAK